MKNKRLKKYIKLIIILIVLILYFSYCTFFYKVSGKNEENSDISTDAIIEKQSDSLRNIYFY